MIGTGNKEGILHSIPTFTEKGGTWSESIHDLWIALFLTLPRATVQRAIKKIAIELQRQVIKARPYNIKNENILLPPSLNLSLPALAMPKFF